MKTIANLRSLSEAQSLKIKLASTGIEAFIPDELSAAVAPHQFFTALDIRLQVAAKDEAEAIKILNTDFPEELQSISDNP